MESILVTGGAGFIGSNLIDRLLSIGQEVICVDNFDGFYSESVKRKNLEQALLNKNFKLYECDIRNQNELEQCFKTSKIGLVIHLAAKAGIRPSIANPIEYYDVNVSGTLSLLELMRKYKVTRMLFASSSSVYGNNSKVPFTEKDIVDSPISPYAASKKAGELLCHTYHHLYNFDVYCLRLFTVYGPRQRPDLAIHKFTNCILNGNPIEIYGDGTTSRDYTYIDDIIDGILLSINKLNGYEVFNLGESVTVSLAQIVDILERKLRTNITRKFLPIQPGDVSKTYSDISKARTLLGYSPKWSVEDGVDNFLTWKLKG